ncbi:Eco57I restriction-modification methylase domain-containing protein [Glutamicibacter soli]|uniref:Eco57I restriction-modification methylase domain-containing protein n=1 Tax=Glutamicibacter soli TaxID=453836 RepID=UPI003FD309AC
MRSLEQNHLLFANTLLDQAATEVCPSAELSDARLTILETVASAVGGWNLEEFWERNQQSRPELHSDPHPWADKLRASIAATPIPVSLALSALSREVLPSAQQRKSGAYYTDWRLAEQLAAQSVPMVRTDGLWIDPACGSGVLLAAAAMTLQPGAKRNHVIREQLTGADLSARALRGALLSVASLTADLDAVYGFASRLFRQDSLRSRNTWAELVPKGAALVIGNPPWEKLKVSRHELATELGQVRHYGQRYKDEIDLTHSRANLLSYIEQVAMGTRFQGKGEHDLYKLFLELGLALAAEDGILAMILPAGLIRSQGTETLRRELIRSARELSISVIENRARHFAIDTRFKFLTMVARVGGDNHLPINLKVADRTGVLPNESVSISRSELHAVRNDLSIPEVRTSDEWELFARLAKNSISIGDPTGPWRPTYRREVDMTLDKKKFKRTPDNESLPLLEGRHISHYRWRAKTYQSGEGRAAIWRPEPTGKATLKPQWYIQPSTIHPASAERAARSRIGFCDITGQTNERSLLLARIPAGVSCGNKVPTLVFADGNADREDLFLALTNSLVVDWMMRRLVTTTVNFFLLNSLPLPKLDEDSAIGKELVQLARSISAAEGDPEVSLWDLGQRRARIDALVASVWSLSLEDMEVVLRDFPLLDRGQPPLFGEDKSTITQDSVLAELAKLHEVQHASGLRLKYAQEQGAMPYIPAEYV